MNNSNEKEHVSEAEKQLAEAHLQMDLAVIDHLLHPDYVIVQPSGQIEHKAEVLASYRSDTRHWHSATSDQMDVRLYGDTAVVIGRWRASGQNGVEQFDYTARFLSVWVKTDKHWQNVAYQSTEISAKR